MHAIIAGSKINFEISWPKRRDFKIEHASNLLRLLQFVCQGRVMVCRVNKCSFFIPAAYTISIFLCQFKVLLNWLI